MKFIIIGNSFPIKDDLRALGCEWDKAKRYWKTPSLEREDLNYKRIKSICTSFSLDLVPLRPREEHVGKIQEIINGIKD